MALDVGRPTVMDQKTLDKLDEAFMLGCSDKEACLYADISPRTLYNYQKYNIEFLQRKEQLKETPVLQARKTVVESLKNSPSMAMQYLERKKKEEFAPRTELTGSEGAPLGYIHSGDLKQLPSSPQLSDGTTK